MPLLKPPMNFRLNTNVRSPNLVTLVMIERTIEKYSGEFTMRKIWEKLPRKVMWGTFKIAVDYLEHINKIGIARGGILVYIWNPRLARRYMKKKGLKYVKK